MPLFTRGDIATWLRKVLGAEEGPIPGGVGLEWVSKATRGFPTSERERILRGWASLTAMEDAVRPVVDIFGTSQLKHVRYVSVQGALATNFVVGTLVPVERVHRILAAQVSHDDAANLKLTLAISHSVTYNPVNVTDGANTLLSSDESRALLREIYVPPLYQLVGRSTAAPAAGKRLTLQYYYLELPLGEYSVSP